MIQDIDSHIFRNEYEHRQPSMGDITFIFQERKILIKKEEDQITFPTYKRLQDEKVNYNYLFAIDGEAYYLADTKEVEVLEGYSWENINVIRTLQPKFLAFAAITAYHLFNWYNSNRFCGKCGLPMTHSPKERALSCEGCGHMVYPRISPAVIVGITDGDRLLITRYAGRESKRYGLVAGFCEIGESAEETVAREVMEEVGLKVKNICYYKSQPWGFSGDLLIGYFAEVDGSQEIVMDENELSEAIWVKREELLSEDDGISLTSEMMLYFKNQIRNE